MERITQVFERNKKWLYFALGATFFWGLLAHAYCFFDNSFSQDSMNEMHGAIFGNHIKIGAGRIFVPIYRDLFRSDVTLPWLVGITSLIWIGLAVFFVLRIFRVESKTLAFLTAGVFTANLSVTAMAATYIQDLDGNMFALLCVAFAVYLWRVAGPLVGIVAGAVLIAGSLGLYQSFVFVAVELVIFACILDLLRGSAALQVLRDGLRAVGMILLGGLLYAGALKIVTICNGGGSAGQRKLQFPGSDWEAAGGYASTVYCWRL